jgi:hypothetical protein
VLLADLFAVCVAGGASRRLRPSRTSARWPRRLPCRRRTRARPWPIAALFALAAVALALEALLAWPRAPAGAAAGDAGGDRRRRAVARPRAPRRVVFVLDVSASVAPAEAEARAARPGARARPTTIARRWCWWPAADRGPAGSPGAIAAWAAAGWSTSRPPASIPPPPICGPARSWPGRWPRRATRWC